MNGYQLASTLAMAFSAIVIGWIYAPNTPTLAETLAACGDLPPVTYMQSTGRYTPDIEKQPDPTEFKVKVDAINQCRQRVIEKWGSNPDA